MAFKTFILKNSELRSERVEAAQDAIRKFLKNDEIIVKVNENYTLMVENSPKKLYTAVTCAGDIMLVALCDKPIGIDGEYLPRMLSPENKIDYIMLAERFFSLEEAEYVHDTSNGTEAENFVRIWVRKEAYVKAIGKNVAEFPNFSVVDNGKFASKIKGVPVKIFKINFENCDDYIFAIAGLE